MLDVQTVGNHEMSWDVDFCVPQLCHRLTCGLGTRKDCQNRIDLSKTFGPLKLVP